MTDTTPILSPQAIIAAQFDNLFSHLAAAEQALERASESIALDSETLRQLNFAFAEARYRLNSVPNRWRDDREYELADRRLMKAGWSALEDLRSEVERVLEETMGFLEAGFTKQLLGADLHTIVDALLVELARRVTPFEPAPSAALAAAESFRGEFAPTIRLRFTETELWALPIMAHEFGHYALSRFERRNSAVADDWRQVLALMNPQRPSELDHLHEHFADVFATYTVGPAYPLACITRFSGITAHVDRPRHPSAVRRVHVILRALEQMERRGAGLRHYELGEVREHLEDGWARILASSEQAGLPPDDTDRLNRVADEFTALMDRLSAVSGAAYADRMARMLGLAGALMEKLQNREDASPASFATEDLELWDVINAAWLVRLRGTPKELGDTTALIHDAAAGLCAALSARAQARQATSAAILGPRPVPR